MDVEVDLEKVIGQLVVQKEALSVALRQAQERINELLNGQALAQAPDTKGT